MFGNKSKEGTAVQRAVGAGVSFEVTIGELARKSERRAWMVAFASLCMSLSLAGGYYFMLPLKEKVPYVVMADPFSGTASVAALRDDPYYRELVSREVLARASVANYVVARESFDAELLKARDWAQVNVMSSGDERRAFAAVLADANPSSPAKFVRNNQAVRVRVSSITGIYDAGRMVGATVRIQRNLHDRSNGALQPIDRRLITLAFRWAPDMELDETLRWLNPLGFLVTQYRSDLDMSSMDPGNLDSAFNAAIETASGLIGERDAAVELLKSQARAAAAAAAGEGVSPEGIQPASGADSVPELPAGIDTPAPSPMDGAPPPDTRPETRTNGAAAL